jgi:hypothetical protein
MTIEEGHNQCEGVDRLQPLSLLNQNFKNINSLDTIAQNFHTIYPSAKTNHQHLLMNSVLEIW